ncbi:MAG: hypothetical protein ABS75_02670 [Pelagibacterium sp. SCN 63-23]|nr:MAG: hypothetical protein ABS75_02670 [Pelagibacterium sp. SCN 63-23]
MSLAKARFPWKIYGLALLLILLFALAPVIGVVLSSWLAQTNGCSLNEAMVNACIILGADWGGLLYMLFVLGWFMLATLPLGAGALIVLVVMLIIHRLAWRQRQVEEAP